MVTPIVNQTIETASRGVLQGFAKSFDYAIGSQDLLLTLGILVVALVIVWWLR